MYYDKYLKLNMYKIIELTVDYNTNINTVTKKL